MTCALREQLDEVLKEGLEALGHLDVVVANAGICPGRDETLCSGFVDATDVDLIGAMNTVAVSLPHLSAGASIIVTGSTAGMIKGTTERMGSSGGVGYAWAKQTVIRYVEVLALQLAGSMIRMNGVHPTNCDTHLLHNIDVYRAFRPDLENPTREDEIERALLRFLRPDGSVAAFSPLFEFSLGVPLGQIAMARGARLLLRWLDGSIDEHELDWLFSTSQAAVSLEGITHAHSLYAGAAPPRIRAHVLDAR